MSKFFNALAVAVLGIALLMGAASADTSVGVTLSGTVDAVSLSIVDSVAAPSLTLTRGSTATATDSMSITANADWKLDVEDLQADGSKGYMSRTGGNLESAFLVGPTGSPAAGLASGPVTIKNDGTAGASSEPVGIAYAQPVSGDEIEGTYSIVLTYTVAARTTS